MAKAFGGDEFSNNLFSDLAPLLTLFGEQVTKQFLSMSMGWADNVLLAMGPLGIITVVVSAIRVGGVKHLKAIIGRARESKSKAEQELLSSTSDDACELWSGQEVVRLVGSAPLMKHLIIPQDNKSVGARTGSRRDRVFDIASAVKVGLYQQQGLPLWGSTEDDILENIRGASPNLSLNVKNATVSKMELRIWAILGSLLQLTALAISGMATYHWKWAKGGIPVAQYGYPCLVVVTATLTVGLLLCGHVIEGITIEHEFSPRSEKIMLVLRLQPACTINDQHFDSYAIFNSQDDKVIRVSRLDESKDYSTLAASATIVTIVGYIVQFIGLRASHWSATIIQLSVTLTMTCIRALVRRGLASDPVCKKIDAGHELAWLALHISCEDTKQQEQETRNAPITCETHSAGAQSTIPMDRLAQPDSPRISTDPVQDNAVTKFHMDSKVAFWGLWAGFLSKGHPRDILLHPFGGSHSEYLLETNDFLKAIGQATPKKTPTIETSLGDVQFQTTTEASKEVDILTDLYKCLPTLDNKVELANKLASAMERTMSLISTLQTVKWKEAGKADPTEGITWSLDISSGFWPGTLTQQRLYFVVGLKRERITLNPYWHTDRQHLHSVLSLWVFTLTRQRSILLSLGSGPSDSWHVVNSSQGSSANLDANHFARIVGIANNLLSLADWLQIPVYPCSIPNGSNIIVDPGVQRSMLQEPAMWPVFGMMVSSIAFEATGPMPEHRNRYTESMIVTREMNLAEQCAHEIFSLFMLAVASNIAAFKGKVEKQEIVDRLPEALSEQGYPYFRLHDAGLSSIGHEVVGSGLVEDLPEALSLIIPAFNKYGLPPEVNASEYC